MSNSVQDQINAEFQKAKAEGGVRVNRIRTILQQALAQTYAELKDGSSEIRSIVKDVVQTTIATPASQTPASEVKSEPKIPVVVEIKDAGEGLDAVMTPVQEETVSDESLVQPILDRIDQSPYAATQSTETVLESEPTEYPQSEPFKSAFSERIQAFKARQFAQWQQDYLSLKGQVLDLDQKLAQRYGDRYITAKQTAKQQVEQAKVWYDNTKIKAEASETDAVQQKQVEVDRKAATLGVSAAQKEREIKQQVKQQFKAFVQTTVAKL